jgi:hypothetical protein
MGKNSSENVKQIKGIIEFYLLCNEEWNFFWTQW